MKRVAWSLLAALSAGCSQVGAPVVDAPVRDRPGAGAKSSAKEHATPTKGKAGAHAAAERPDADWRPDVYTVKKGDTLYNIALDHGQDYRDIAAWNKLVDPNVILVGQQLRVRAPEGWSEGNDAGSAAVVTRPVAPPLAVQPHPLEDATAPLLKKGPKAVKVPYSDKAFAELGGTLEKTTVSMDAKPAASVPQSSVSAPAPGSAPKAQASAVSPPGAVSTAAGGSPPSTAPGGAASAPPAAAKPAAVPGKTAVATKPVSQGGWTWPAKGRVLFEFNKGPNPKGITIVGNAGDPVLASAGGRVVYSGSGLRGYGKLIIVKHDTEYLSVYAHNRELLVKEGQRVEKGQKIAEMGDSDADRVGLHFEIRKLGKPVDPLPFLQAGAPPAAAGDAQLPQPTCRVTPGMQASACPTPG